MLRLNVYERENTLKKPFRYHGNDTKGTLGLCCLADLNSTTQLAVMLQAT